MRTLTNARHAELWARKFNRRVKDATGAVALAAKDGNAELLDALQPTAAALAREFDSALAMFASNVRHERAKVQAK